MVITLRLFNEYKKLKQEHDFLKKQVLNNQTLSERNQDKLHKSFLEKKKEFKKNIITND